MLRCLIGGLQSFGGNNWKESRHTQGAFVHKLFRISGLIIIEATVSWSDTVLTNPEELEQTRGLIHGSQLFLHAPDVECQAFP